MGGRAQTFLSASVLDCAGWERQRAQSVHRACRRGRTHQLDVCCELHLSLARKALDLPHQARPLHLVFGFSPGDDDGGASRVAGHRDAHDDPRGCQRGVEARGAHFDCRLDARAAHLADDGHHLERQDHVVRHAVLHQLELAIRWHERHRLIAGEAAQVDALVEGDVVELDGFAAASQGQNESGRALHQARAGPHPLASRPEGAPPNEVGPLSPPPSPPLSRSFSPSFSSGMPCVRH